MPNLILDFTTFFRSGVIPLFIFAGNGDTFFHIFAIKPQYDENL
jgi:hypothetical protein